MIGFGGGERRWGMDVLGGAPAPFVGWRIWRMTGEGLVSWAVNYTWEPGPNRAVCLRQQRGILPPEPACPVSPGPGCACGLWGVWDLAGVVARARDELLDPFASAPVIGLVMGWGEVAVHGVEGFRASHASIQLLIEDSPWSALLDGLGAPHGWLAALRRRLGGEQADIARRRALERVRARYGVPIHRLDVAARSGLLAELGLPLTSVRAVKAHLVRRR